MDESETSFAANWDGKTYYFDTQEDLDLFQSRDAEFDAFRNGKPNAARIRGILRLCKERGIKSPMIRRLESYVDEPAAVIKAFMQLVNSALKADRLVFRNKGPFKTADGRDLMRRIERITDIRERKATNAECDVFGVPAGSNYADLVQKLTKKLSQNAIFEDNRA